MDGRRTDASGRLLKPVSDQVQDTFMFPNGEWNIRSYNDCKESVEDEVKKLLHHWDRLMIIDILHDVAASMMADKTKP